MMHNISEPRTTEVSGLEKFFSPRSVAVVGASREPRKFGHVVFENFIERFRGHVYPINPNAQEIMGRKCYSSVTDVPGELDLVVIVVPASAVAQTVDDCVAKKVPAIIILSAGFREVGRQDMEEEIYKKIKGTKTRIIGPNCIGVFDSHSHVDTIFNPFYRQQRPMRGGIAFISQSGAFGAAMMDWMASEGVGLSKFISIGNRLDVNELELLEYLNNDERTRVVVMYVEGIESGRGREFYEQLKRMKKPVVVFKAGKTKAGSKAALSHTGSLAGSSRIYSAAFKQAGAIEAQTIDQLFNYAEVLATQPLPHGKRVQIVTNAGGFGVVASDAVEHAGLQLAQLSKESTAAIKKFVPDYAIVANPIDLVGDADSKRYEDALNVVFQDDEVDSVLVIMLMQISALQSDITDVLIGMKESYKKPLVVCTIGGEFTSVHTRMLEKQGIPIYNTPEETAEALAVLSSYAERRRFMKA